MLGVKRTNIPFYRGVFCDRSPIDGAASEERSR